MTGQQVQKSDRIRVSSAGGLARIGSIRRTRRPSKQLLWLMVAKDVPKYSKVDKGIEFACGRMFNLSFFRSNSYIGSDLIDEELRKGKERLGEDYLDRRNAKVFCADLFEVSDQLKGSFVCCFETIGITSLFDGEVVRACLKLANHVLPGGHFLFNVRYDKIDQRQNLYAALCDYFEEVEVISYGRWTGETGPLRAFLLGLILFVVPFLRAESGREQWGYYRCLNRTQVTSLKFPAGFE